MTEQITDSIDDAMTPDQSYWDSLLAEDPVPTFDTEVQRRAYRLRVDRAAHDLLDAENRPTPEPLDVATLADVLTRPAPTADRIEGLAPWEGSTLITAMRKTGKTTMAGNLARCLITGAPFLGRFEVKPLNGTLAFLNYEVSGHQLARWLDEMGVDQDRVLLANLRGRANPLTHPDARGELSERLKVAGVEAIIVDPFGRAFTGDDQNNAGQVTKFLVDLETFTRAEVGARDLFLTNHAGWEGERSRGSTALEDWPDALWRIVRDKDDDGDGTRFFSAFGRDVEVAEDALLFDPDTRRLSLSGTGGRKQANANRRQDELIDACVRIVALMPGVNSGSLEERLKTEGYRFQRGAGSRAARAAADAGLLRVESGRRNSKRFYPVNLPEYSRPFPGKPLSIPDPPIGGAYNWEDLGGESSRTEDGAA